MVLAEQWVLVTGGARGLGQSITRALAREGAGVVINYHRSQAAADALQAAVGFQSQGISALLIDTSPQPSEAAKLLANAMGASYVPLPYAGAEGLSRAVSLATAPAANAR